MWSWSVICYKPIGSKFTTVFLVSQPPLVKKVKESNNKRRNRNKGGLELLSDLECLGLEFWLGLDSKRKNKKPKRQKDWVSEFC